MKILQAAVLVLVGALGAMLYLKVKGGPETPAPATQVASQQALPAPTPATAKLDLLRLLLQHVNNFVGRPAAVVPNPHRAGGQSHFLERGIKLPLWPKAFF